MSNNLPQVSFFKYRIGDRFINNKGDTVEITGYNYLMNCYKGMVTFRISSTYTTLESNIIYEEKLDLMSKYDEKQEVGKMANQGVIRYKIYYVDPNEKSEKLRGQKVQNITIQLSGLRPLAKMLNNMIKRNPQRRITLVSIVDENDKYLSHVKFLPQEIKTQTFLTGMKQRLLAHAKYERGYEVAIGF